LASQWSAAVAFVGGEAQSVHESRESGECEAGQQHETYA